MSEQIKVEDGYPAGFFNELDNVRKNELLKNFTDLIFKGIIDPMKIEEPTVKKCFIELYMEADLAALSMEKKLSQATGALSKDNRSKRREKSVKERAKEAGLVTVTANIPQPKKLIL